MVKITYRGQEKEADLAAKSVAEVREVFKAEFGLPDRAHAVLNGEQLKRKLEPETRLCDQDELYFETSSHRSLVLAGALLLALAVTGGLFAYTQTTITKTITATGASSDYATVSDNGTDLDYSVMGKKRGTIGSGVLFDIVIDSAYTGDLEVQVYLANPDELQTDYSSWLIRLELEDAGGTQMDLGTDTMVLSLDNPVVSFEVDDWTQYSRYVKCEGGSFRAFGNAWVDGDNPLIFCNVLQR